MKPKALVLWSGGKDSALALHEARVACDIVALVTTVTQNSDRVRTHDVRTALLRRQAQALGYPLKEVLVSPACPNDEYEAKMRAALEEFRPAGVTAVVCGDIFLEEVRRYREDKIFPVGMQGIFPLWQRGSADLARHFLALGFRAVLCCVDTHALDPSFAGRCYDPALLADLPRAVDPCGENGEFHTFVFDGPGFTQRVAYTAGERVWQDGRFCCCDLIPGPG